jgi:hypothetical protein
MQGLQASSASDYRDIMKLKSSFSALLLLLIVSSLSACGVMDRIRAKKADVDVAPAVAVAPDGIGPVAGAQSADVLDQSTPSEIAAATAAPVLGAERNLGSVVVALGSPAEQGFWLRSGLVTTLSKGRVVTAAGKSVNVDLQPATGAALLSLAAYRELGLSLTDLPSLTVYTK